MRGNISRQPITPGEPGRGDRNRTDLAGPRAAPQGGGGASDGGTGTSIAHVSRSPHVALILAGLAMALVLALGFLRPLAIWEHGDVVAGHQPLAEVLGLGREGVTRYLGALIAAFGVFAVAAFVARRVAGAPGFWTVLAGTALFSLTLLPINPVGSQDIYHNIADARTLWIYGDNPVTTPPSAHSNDPIFQHLSAWEDEPSAYGPLWYTLSGVALPFTGSELWPNVIAQKAIASVFLLAATALVMLIVRRTSPGDEITGGVLVGWNPLVLFETAGNAHNDIMMVAFGLGAFYVLVRGDWIGVFALLALAVAVKPVFALLGPLLLIWMLRHPDITRAHLAVSLAVGAAVGLLVYAPYIVNPRAVETLLWQGKHILASPGSAMTSLLIEHADLEVGEATKTMRLTLTPLFLAGYAVVCVRLWRPRPVTGLFTSSAWALFLFLATVAWWFWPWYVTWLLPIAALTPRHRIALLATVFSVTAMLMYAAYYWQVYEEWHRMQRITATVVFLVPLLLALLLALWPRGNDGGAGPAQGTGGSDHERNQARAGQPAGAGLTD